MRKNNFMRVISVMIALCLIIGSMTIPASASSKYYVKIKITQNYAQAQKVLKYINKERSKRGLRKLKLDKSLCTAAVQRCAETAIMIPSTSPHKRPDGKKAHTVNKRICYECCAQGFETPKDVVDGWMDSPTHRKGLLLKNAKSVGIGCTTISGGDLYWSVEFSGTKAKKIEKRKSKVVTKKKVYMQKKLMKEKYLKIEAYSIYFTSMETGQTAILKGDDGYVIPYYRSNKMVPIYQTKLDPSNFYTWESSNPSVISVDRKGNIKALKKGSSVISIKMKQAPGYTIKKKIEVWDEEDLYVPLYSG